MSTLTLLKYMSYGGVACVIVAGAYRSQVTGKLINQPYYKESMRLLNQHKAADVMLGKPINSGYLDVFSSKNYADSKLVNLHVPLKGSKTKGELFLKAVKNIDGGEWIVKRVELEIKDSLGGKILIFNDEDKDVL